MIKSVPLLLLSVVLLSGILGCQKIAFHDDHCTGNCYVLSGQIFADSVTPSVNEPITITFGGTKGILKKNIAQTISDENGFWQMSFDADYIQDISNTELVFEHPHYLRHAEDIVLSSEHINIEKHFQNTMYRSGTVNFSINLTHNLVQRIQARYVFNGKTYKVTKSASDEKPVSVDLIQILPADHDIVVSLYFSSNNNAMDQTNWTILEGFPMTFNVGYQDTKSVEIDF